MEKNYIFEILKAAHMAPSADNCQPWIFEVQENEIRVWHDLSRAYVTDLYNIDYFADYISLGCVIENIFIAANHFGYTVDMSHNFSNNVLYADLKFKKTHEEFLCEKYNSIFKRKTNRKLHLKKIIPKKISDELKILSKEYGAELHWVEDRKKISKLAHFIGKHDVILWEKESARKNLLRMLRFGKEKNLDGLHVDSLELGIKKFLFFPMIWFAGHFNFFWKIMSFNSVLHTKKHVKKSGALCLLTIPENYNPVVYLKGGRIMQSLWIHLTSHGIYMQPIFGIIALLIHKKLGMVTLLPHHKKIRDDITDFFYATFPNLKNSTPIALFLVGYAENPSAISSRRELEDVIKKTI